MFQSNIQRFTLERDKRCICHRSSKHHGNMKYAFSLYIVFFGCLVHIIHCTVGSVNDVTIATATPELRLDKQELTTVLLLRNGNEQNNGRFINVRPEVGLLTSTARTFIQEGITTEYKTQVVGTTLDNGRMYAHLLKKSSRILYDPSVLATDSVLSEPYRKTADDYESLSKNLPQSHNDLFNADKSDWRAIDDSIFFPRNNFITNTDLSNGLNGKRPDNIEFKKHMNQPTYEVKAIKPKVLIEENKQLTNNVKPKVMPQKVLPEANLPTFTIKHHYEPSGYAYKNYTHFLINDGVGDNINGELNNNLNRQPKNILEIGEMIQDDLIQMKNRNLLPKKSHLSTVTYYGFSDFTTTVGDSVIVFSPSIVDSVTSILNANVTSITGEITINDATIFTTKSYADTTSTMLVESKSQYSKYDDTMDKESIIYDDHNVQNETMKILHPSENSMLDIYSNTKESSVIDSLIKSKEISITDLNVNIDQDSSNTNYNMMESSSKNVTNVGGATTIFFENDPFTNFLSTSSSTSTIFLSSLQTTTTESTFIKSIDEEKWINVENDELPESTIVFTSSQNDVPELSSSVIIKEIDYNDTNIDTTCSKTSQVFLTNSPKTIETTYTSTRYIVSDQTTKTLTDYHLDYVQSFHIGETTKYYCIQTVPAFNEQLEVITEKQPEIHLTEDHATSKTTIETVVTTTTTETVNAEENFIVPTIEIPDTYSISTTTTHLTKTDVSQYEPEDVGSRMLDTLVLNTELFIERIEKEEIESTEKNEIDEGKEDEEDEEEIELFYKTFYTTYTYLTTYFQEQNTSISSHTEVVTNVITSTVANGIDSTYINDNIIPTKSITLDSPIDSTLRFMLPNDIKSYLIKRKEKEELEPSVIENVQLFNENNICNNDKTYYTTYTYYTTIFGGDGTEISSRTEVHTNFIKPTKIEHLQNEQNPCSKLNLCQGSSYYLNSVNGTRFMSDPFECGFNKTQSISNNTSMIDYTALKISNDINNKIYNHDKEIKRQIFDDQINSESNADDEILTSAAVLLKTSFTTYTYYTTIYRDNATDVVSRLETITNTHTETLRPIAKTQTVEDISLPITYFTTYTYWTKLAKDGHITTLSHEETVSNVITPTRVDMTGLPETQTLNLIDYYNISTSQMLDNVNNVETIYMTQLVHPIYEGLMKIDEEKKLDSINSDSRLIPTTYYTTYTYYTTSYEANSTITNSRLETVTNIVTPKAASSLNRTDNIDNIDYTGNTYTKNKEAAFYELKKVIDGDGISTLYITTKIEPTFGINGEYSDLTSTSTSLYVNETKKYLLSTFNNAVGSDTQKQKVYKTGLVRLIDGTRIANSTTTLFKSKVIGTIIDQRYAQIIESTSSFLFNPNTKDLDDLISSTKVYDSRIETTMPFSQNASSIEGINTTQKLQTVYNESSDHTKKEERFDELNRDDSNVETKKTPIVRPFAKHNRTQFLQKKTLLSPSSATIITRSDFTPTITATPALKSVNRFTSSRRGSSVISSTPIGFNGPSRRFGRGPLKHTSQASPISSRNRLNNITSKQPLRSISSLGYKRLSGLSIRPTHLRPSAFSSVPSANAKFGRNRFSGSDSNVDETNSSGESVDTKDINQEFDLKDNVAIPQDQQQINSLLRNRKLQPSNNKSNRISSGAKPFNYNTVRTRNNPLRPQSRATTISTTVKTTTTRPRSFQRPILPQRDRLRSSSNLFPPRNIFGTTKSQPIEDTTPEDKDNIEEIISDDNRNDEGVDYDDEEDEDEILEEDDVEDLNRNRRSYDNVTLLLKSNLVKRSRVKRKADNVSPGHTNFRNRLGRLKKQSENLQKIEDVNINTTTPPNIKTTRPINVARLNNKHHGNVIAPSRSIRPTRFMTEARSKFTLRDKDSSPSVTANTQKNQKNRSNFRRPFSDTSASMRQSTNDNISNNNDNRRLKNYSGRNSDLSTSGKNSRNSIPARSSNSGNGRSRSTTSRDFGTRNRGRGQNSNSQNSELVLDNDGTITITHVIPVGTTIPVINGKITEYKEVQTAKTTTEILGPLQYTSISNGGQVQLQLTRQDTSVNNAGVTEVTQYILHETPTTTVTFTPTTIRGRRTSFSHILPSTVYSVERLTSTIQPQIISNAPLANILLSQLLLGNVGLSPGVNPFLAALGGPTPTAGVISSMLATPVTEYKTHAKTYVTTVYEGQSTVLPVTFQGKKILTTVYDTTAQTITATEFITDTVITTPSVMVPQVISPVQPVVNSLLLQQLLLQQHLQSQPSSLEYPANILKGILDITSSAYPLNLNGDNLQELDGTNNIRSQSHDLIQGDFSSESGTIDVEDAPLIDQTNNHKIGRKKSRKSNKNKSKPQVVPTTLQSSSVITLYVSGRRPGEFSTILSTVPIRPDNTLYKRHAPDVFKTSVWNSMDYVDNDEINNDLLNLDFPSVNSEPTPVLNTLSNDIKHKPSITLESLSNRVTNIPITSSNHKNSELFSV